MYRSETFDLTSGSHRKVLENNLLTIARSYTPVKTGNMKYSSIYLIHTLRGFKIVWDLDRASYIEYVNEGYGKMSPKKIANMGFVDRAFAALYGYVDYYQRKNGNVKRYLTAENGKWKFSNVYGLYGYINQRKKQTNENYKTEKWIRELGLSRTEMMRSLTDVLFEKTGARATTPSLVEDTNNNEDFSKYVTPKSKRLVQKTLREMYKSRGAYVYVDEYGDEEE